LNLIFLRSTTTPGTYLAHDPNNEKNGNASYTQNQHNLLVSGSSSVEDLSNFTVKEFFFIELRKFEFSKEEQFCLGSEFVVIGHSNIFDDVLNDDP
jgi:hypothetical protein